MSSTDPSAVPENAVPENADPENADPENAAPENHFTDNSVPESIANQGDPDTVSNETPAIGSYEDLATAAASSAAASANTGESARQPTVARKPVRVTDSTQQSALQDNPEISSAHDPPLATNPHKWRLFWGLLFLASLPLLIPYMIDMWDYDRYRYFPFAIASVAWLAYSRSDGKFYPPRSWFAWSLVGFACLLIAGGAVVTFPWFAAVGFVILAACCLSAMRGPEDKSLLVTALPLLTLVQLPRLDVLLTQDLQNMTTWLSSVMLDATAVPHTVNNRVIQLAQRELFVAEACSGIQSVFTLGFLACLMIAWRRRPIWLFPVYLAIACFLAVVANVIRVTIVAWGTAWYDLDLAVGWPHDLLGYSALLAAALFLLSFDHLVVTLLHIVQPEGDFNPLISTWNYFAIETDEESVAQVRSDRAGSETDRQDQRLRVVQLANQYVGNKALGIAFASIVGVVTLASAFQVLNSDKPRDIIFSDDSLVFDPAPNMLNESLSYLSIVKHTPNRGYEDPRLGANSDVWDCRVGDIDVKLVLSQPHKGWHELCDCYERLDWLLINRSIKSTEAMEQLEVTATSPDALRVPYVVARFKKEPGLYAYLLFAGIGSDGSLIAAPSSLSAFTHRVWNKIDGNGVWNQNEVIMLQMFITSPRKIKPSVLQELEEEFVSARSTFANAISENANRHQAYRIPSSDQGEGASGPVRAGRSGWPEKSSRLVRTGLIRQEEI